MASKYIVADGGRMVIEKWAGNVSSSEIVEHEKAQCMDPSIVQGAVVIVDIRQAIFPEATPESSRNFASLLAQPDNREKFSRFALLVSGKVWETAKVLESETEKLGVRIIAFTDVHVACTWLGLETEKILKGLDSIDI